MPFLRRCALALPLAAATTLLVRHLLQSPPTGIDDADIFLVYAKNLSTGHGLVFNAGGERVEGFTSLLWVLLCAPIVAISSHPERILSVLTALLTVIAAAACLGSFALRQDAARDGQSLPWSFAFLVLLFSDVRFSVWNTATLMDTALWTCLVA